VAEKMGLLTANPEPVIEEEPLLHTRPTPGYKSGGSRAKTTEADAEKPFKANALGRCGTVFQVRPAQFIGVPLLNHQKNLRVQNARTTQIVSTLPPGATLPRYPPTTATASNHRLFLLYAKRNNQAQPEKGQQVYSPCNAQEATGENTPAA
jgi:hypothetical protein